VKARLRLSACLALAATSEAAAAPPLQEDPGPIQDPDDSPFMRAPQGQLGRWSAGRPPRLTRSFSDRRRAQLTLLPAYAAVRVPLVGRTGGCAGISCTPQRGVGAQLELDVRLVRWLWLRVLAGHSVHPVSAVDVLDSEDEDPTLNRVARAGTYRATTFALGLVYPLDLGRILPLLDLGVGGMTLTGPPAASTGQTGGPCGDGGVCEAGLTCGTDDVCRPTVLPQAHVGLGVDVLLGRRWALGGQIRYHAFLAQPGVFPVYVIGALRLAARF
jgi:hypothetical protein